MVKEEECRLDYCVCCTCPSILLASFFTISLFYLELELHATELENAVWKIEPSSFDQDDSVHKNDISANVILTYKVFDGHKHLKILNETELRELMEFSKDNFSTNFSKKSILKLMQVLFNGIDFESSKIIKHDVLKIKTILGFEVGVRLDLSGSLKLAGLFKPVISRNEIALDFKLKPHLSLTGQITVFNGGLTVKSRTSLVSNADWGLDGQFGWKKVELSVKAPVEKQDLFSFKRDVFVENFNRDGLVNSIDTKIPYGENIFESCYTDSKISQIKLCFQKTKSKNILRDWFKPFKTEATLETEIHEIQSYTFHYSNINQNQINLFLGTKGYSKSAIETTMSWKPDSDKNMVYSFESKIGGHENALSFNPVENKLKIKFDQFESVFQAWKMVEKNENEIEALETWGVDFNVNGFENRVTLSRDLINGKYSAKLDGDVDNLEFDLVYKDGIGRVKVNTPEITFFDAEAGIIVDANDVMSNYTVFGFLDYYRKVKCGF